MISALSALAIVILCAAFFAGNIFSEVPTADGRKNKNPPRPKNPKLHKYVRNQALTALAVFALCMAVLFGVFLLGAAFWGRGKSAKTQTGRDESETTEIIFYKIGG
jgi:ABC-type Fe3+ transport system permease subunit